GLGRHSGLGPARGVGAHARSTHSRPRGHAHVGAGRGYAEASFGSAPTPGLVAGTPTPAWTPAPSGIVGGIAITRGNAGSAGAPAGISGRIAIALVARIAGPIAIAGRAIPIGEAGVLEAGVLEAGVYPEANGTGCKVPVTQTRFP